MEKLIDDMVCTTLWCLILVLIKHWLGFEEMTLVALGYLLSAADVIKGGK